MMKYKWLQRNVKIKARENTKELEQRQDGGQTLINLIITAKQNTVSLYHSGKMTLLLFFSPYYELHNTSKMKIISSNPQPVHLKVFNCKYNEHGCAKSIIKIV